ncbi:MAG TPA: hypothetical protein VLM42_17215 [Bryobacteraceae bacterium]|nr:hypothetical protein [Bryobacteraceae bacterium]
MSNSSCWLDTRFDVVGSVLPQSNSSKMGADVSNKGHLFVYPASGFAARSPPSA